MQHWLSRSLVGLLLLMNLVWSLTASANETPADVRIIVDISGSMKQTDPDNLRVPATNLLIELIPDDSQAGIWTFGRFVNMLTPLAQVDDAWRQQARADAQKINSVGLRTNLVEALDKARWQLAPDSGYQQSIILLTDGRIDMASGANAEQVNQAERQRLSNEVLPAYAAANARIHTLALSDAADKDMLRQIALETGGLYQEAINADELLVAFLRAFDRAVPTEQVPMVDNTFTIDDSVTEFTALIFKRSSDKPVQLLSPSGEVLNVSNSAENSQVRWHEELNYDLITVTAPAAGDWQADADIDPENRVQVLTDLRLQVNGLPETIFAGYPVDLDMALTNQGETITEPALLRLTDVSIKVTAPDGRIGSKLLSDPESLPPDGVYRESLSRLAQPGTYQLEVTASGPTFQRRQQLTATLMEPLRIRSREDHQQQQASVSVEPLVASIDTGLSRIIARVISPDGSSVIQSMEFDTAQQSWRLQLMPAEGPGRYEVELNVRGVTASGTTFKTRPEPLSFDFPLQDPNAPVTAKPDVTEPAVSEPEIEPAPATSTATVNAQPELAPATPAKAPAAKPQSQPEPVEPAVDSEPELVEPVDEAIEDEGGIAWWVYLLLAVGNASVLGGAAWWWLRHRRQQDTEALTQTDAHESHLPPDLEAPELSDDELGGSFDSFDGLDEEEIQPQPEAPAGMGSDTDITPDSLDDEFSIDPDDNAAPDLEDDWGEFDVDDELGSEPDDTQKPD
ncbi:hypothetical protein GCM10011297_12080 [Bacterioplanes sanyensis]|uniref:VWA domain-containing protein n=1 Tax=Bacterioplanes sanyensis TaxID=1249553 RepID=UPI00167636F6|nr:vWA domain-containing protein [Bacterioplanes sanyensis]GGY40722.1 hypothetical protein GCM10011297_12080 [Bacterioplanes sanyensis]